MGHLCHPIPSPAWGQAQRGINNGVGGGPECVKWAGLVEGQYGLDKAQPGQPILHPTPWQVGMGGQLPQVEAGGQGVVVTGP